MGKRLQKSKVQVTLSIEMKDRSTHHTVDLSSKVLPQSFGVEGLLVTVKEAGSKAKSKKTQKDKKVPRNSRNKRVLRVTLPPAQRAKIPTWQAYGVLGIAKQDRAFFPKYKEDFVLRSPRGEFIVKMASANNTNKDALRGGYISSATKFFKAHSDLVVGDTLVFRKVKNVTIDGKSYKCYNVTVK
jgi:hypothetical protein